MSERYNEEHETVVQEIEYLNKKLVKILMTKMRIEDL